MVDLNLNLNLNLNLKMVNITKASGETVAFDPEKLRRSLHRAGASRDHAEAVVRAIQPLLREGMTTKAIYRQAHRMLRRDAPHTAARYSLKQALLELGPSGYPFEQFIAKLMEADGFSVQTGVLQAGHCVQHELDVLATSGQLVRIGECKFHNHQNLVSDVKVPLYIHSRFQDLRAGFLSGREWAGKTIEGWIFTNTRFTDDALQYGRCMGMHLISWDTPFDAGLRDWVDRTGLHPLTCLTALTRHEKDALLERKIVLARDLLLVPEHLQDLRVPAGRMQGILDEAEKLCAPMQHL